MADDEPGTEEVPEVAPESVDVSLLEAKVAQLTIQVAELTEQLAAKDAEIVAAKAANYDLLTATPVPDVEPGDEISPDAVDVEEITVDDLFRDKDND